MNSIKYFFGISAIFFFVFACGTSSKKTKRGLNLFTIQQDRDLGLQVANEIDGDPTKYPVLDSLKYKEVYKYLYSVRDNILNSGKVDLKDKFQWRFMMITL